MEKYSVFATVVAISIICFLLAINKNTYAEDRLFLLITSGVFGISGYLEYKFMK